MKIKSIINDSTKNELPHKFQFILRRKSFDSLSSYFKKAFQILKNHKFFLDKLILKILFFYFVKKKL